MSRLLVLLFLAGLLFSACSGNPVLENAVRRANRDAEQSGSPYRFRITPQGLLEKYSIGPASEVPERWTFSFDGRLWQVGYQAANEHLAVREYVLAGETVHSWTELVTSLYSPKNISVKAWFEEFKRGLSQRCPSIRFSIIEESVDDIIYEWQHDRCQSEPPQQEIRRLVRGPNGVFSLSYVEKTELLPPEKRRIWLSIIRAATIKSDA